jgi:imidazolonepropionase-like amidohydrolase
MGVIAFVRQSFLDAQHYAGARGFQPSGSAELDPAFEAMQPALERKMPVAFEANQGREILRALRMANELKLDPIVTGARDAAEVAADLKPVRVIYSLNYPTRPRTLAPDADETLETLRTRANAPKVPGELAKAGVTFAFESAGLADPKDFVKNAARAVKAGLPADAAVRALTIDAAKIAGAGDRLGSIEKGKSANLIVIDGDLFDEKMTVKKVFVDGRPVAIEAAAAAPGGRGRGRGGQ